MISKAFGAAVAGVVLGPWAASSRIVTGRPRNPVGFQNSAKAADQRFQATDTDGLSKPPRIGRRRILPRTGSGTGASGRGSLVMDLGEISRDAGSSFATGRAVHGHRLAVRSAWVRRGSFVGRDSPPVGAENDVTVSDQRVHGWPT